jgi:hypothetical protein
VVLPIEVPSIDPPVIIAELKDCEPEKVWAASVLAIVADVVGNVIVVESVPAKVNELLAVKVFPFAIVNVALVVGEVRVTLFIVVAVATPRVGVIKEGEVCIANVVPVPV